MKLRRPHSIEREGRRAMRRLFFYRLLGDLIALPRMLLNTLALWVLAVERTFFYLELDAARRYRAITNVDLALAVGEEARYVGLGQLLAQQRDDQYIAAREADE